MFSVAVKASGCTTRKDWIFVVQEPKSRQDFHIYFIFILCAAQHCNFYFCYSVVSVPWTERKELISHAFSKTCLSSKWIYVLVQKHTFLKNIFIYRVLKHEVYYYSYQMRKKIINVLQEGFLVCKEAGCKPSSFSCLQDQTS